ncbi:hypothetical protein ASPVEDRAFT_114128, partial [Aspergillus versicolor CBS 583.65]
RQPCLNCVKAGIPCVFPKPARNLRRVRESPGTDIWCRLKQLEDLVRDLQHPIYSDVEAIGSTAAGSGQATIIEKCPYLETDPRVMPQKYGTHEEFGRLVVDHGCGRYISNRLWASLSDQIDELHELLEPSYSAGEYLSPDSSRPNNHYHNDCFLFGFNSVAHTLANYHPSATQIAVLWNKYQQNVAPLVMVLHPETVNMAFQCYQVCPEVLDEVSECMLFAVYFSAAASMSEQECLVEFEDTKEAVRSHFRFAIEQGFVKAGLTTAKNLNLLQAAVLYLKSLRSLGETRFAWSMTSLVVRLATGLGLHRDGSTFGLEPFEVEMRRRLWWCICILDIETAEDQGTDPMLHDVFYDTRLPLNINDDDVDPFVKDLPQEQSGFTDLTYFLLQCEVALATRRLTYHLPGSPCPALQSIEERRSLVEDLDRRLNERYVRHLDPNSALQSVCIKLVRISIAKLSLIIHQPLDKDQKIPHDVRDKIISHAIEMIELSHTLHMDVRLAKWKWEFQTHIPWHALAFVLSEMCCGRESSILERAWPSISTIFKEWQRDAISQSRTIWQPLSKLMVRATYCRSKQ